MIVDGLEGRHQTQFTKSRTPKAANRAMAAKMIAKIGEK